MAEKVRCGSTDTTTGKPCRWEPGESCPYHPDSGLSDQKRRAADLLRSGQFTRQEVAAQCGVTARTIRNWMNKHEQLEAAADEGDEAQYQEVVSSWIARLKSGDHSGAEMIFYLKNRRPDLWSDRKHLQHSGEIDTGGDVHVYLPDNDRDDLPEQLRRRAAATNGTGS